MGASLISVKEEHSPWERGTNCKRTNLVLTKALPLVTSPVNPKVMYIIKRKAMKARSSPSTQRVFRICYKEYICLYRLL